MAILVIAEHDNHALKSGVANTVAAAQKLGGEIHVLVAGQGCAAAARAAAAIAGVGKVLAADPAPQPARVAENLAPLILGPPQNYSDLPAAATPFGNHERPPRAGP